MTEKINQLIEENRCLKNLIGEIVVGKTVYQDLQDRNSKEKSYLEMEQIDLSDTQDIWWSVDSQDNTRENPIDTENSAKSGTRHRTENNFSLKEAKVMLEIKMITKALESTGGNRTRAARLLEISHPSLLSKIKTYGLDL